MEDSRIIELYFARNEDAIRHTDDTYGRRLFVLADNIVRNDQDAEESVSDTYLAVWNAIPPRKPDPLAGFVYQTGRNQALKKLRSRTALKRCGNYDLSLEELSGCIPGPALEETVEARDLGNAIDRFLDRQSAQSRAIFLRRYWFGDNVKDIARDFSMKESAVSLRLSRTREKLRTFLQKEGYADV